MARVAVHFDGVATGARLAARQTVSGIRDVGNAADREGRRVGLFGSRTTSSFGAATKASHGLRSAFFLLAGAAGIAGVEQALSSVAKAAIHQETVQAALRTQLERTGIAYSSVKDHIYSVIEAQSQLSAFDDEDLAQSFTAIVRITGDVNKALTLNALAANVARGRHIDLQSAAQLVGKVYGGNIGILARYGIQLAKGTTATEALAELQRRFAGQAETYGKTTQGSFDRAQVAIDNVKEALGKGLLPVLTRAANKLSEWANDPKVQESLTRWGNLIGERIAGGLRAIGKWVSDHRAEIGSFFRVTGEAAGALAASVHRISTVLSKTLVPAVGGWDKAFEIGFGALALKKLGLFRLGLAGGGGAGAAAGGGSILSALTLLTRGPWVIPIALEFAFKDEIAGSRLGKFLQGSSFGKAWAAAWNKIADVTGLPVGIPGAGAVSDTGGGGSGPGSAPGGRKGGRGGSLTGAGATLNPAAAIGHSTHDTKGLGGYPALDIMATPGTKVLAPADGRIIRHSGRPVSEGVKDGDIFGLSLYYATDDGSYTYFITHLSSVMPVGEYAEGDVIGIVANWGGRSHAHVGVHKGVDTKVKPNAGFDSSVTAPDKPAKKKKKKATGAAAAAAKAMRERVSAALASLPTSIEGEELGPYFGSGQVDAREQTQRDKEGKKVLSAYEKQAAKLAAGIKAANRKAIEDAAAAVRAQRERYAAAFASLAERASRVFDAKTAKLIRDARVLIGGISLGEGDETVAERAYREFQENRAAADKAKQRADQIAGAATPEEAAAIAAQFALDDQEDNLRKAAEAERNAADKALDTERQRIQDERDAIRERFEARLQQIKTGFDNETITAQRAQEETIAALKEYGVDFAAAGALMGDAFAAGYQDSLASAGIIAGGVLPTSVGQATATPGGVAAGSYYGTLSPYNPTGFARGGKVRGMYIGRDSVPAMLSPGETVIDRGLTAKLERLVGGTAGGVVHVHNPVLLNEQGIDQLARLIQGPLTRVVSYRNSP